MGLPVIIIGAGGHAKVLLSILDSMNLNIIGITDTDKKLIGEKMHGLSIIGDDQVVFNYNPEAIMLVNGVGSTKTTEKRKSIYNLFKSKSYNFLTLIHPSTTVSYDVTIGEGVQAITGAIIHPYCRIGENTVIGGGSFIGHDCKIGKHVFIAPGVTICGGGVNEDGAHVGPGATVIQGVRIGANSVVGAGSLILKNVSFNTKVYGVPGKVVSK